MILTICSQTEADAGLLALELANRRADAGRNVLLLKQLIQKNSAKPVTGGINTALHTSWLATEMKAGALAGELSQDQVIKELSCTHHFCREIVVDLARLADQETQYVLAASNLVLFSMQLHNWNLTRQKALLQSIHAARLSNPELSVLVQLDASDSELGKNILRQLKNCIPDLRSIEATRSSVVSVATLYREIYQSSIPQNYRHSEICFDRN